MAIENTNILTPDIYLAANYVDRLKAKYIDIPEDTLFLGIYGYLQSIHQNFIQNTATMAAEYSLEAIPTKAKFERNLVAHALALGINHIGGKPAEIDVNISFPESGLISNMENNRIVIDKNSVFYIGEDKNYPYILDFNIIIDRVELPNGEWAYTARYDIDPEYDGIRNPLANLSNPYLPTLGKFKLNNENLVAMRTKLRQLTHTVIYKDIVVDNPLESLSMTFEFQDQLSHFYVEVQEDRAGYTEEENYHCLDPIYDGIYNYNSSNEFINYTYLDTSTIRLNFNRSSYQPRYNASVSVHVFTTLGEECNFDISSDFSTTRTLTSTDYNYNNLFYILQPASSSQLGEDGYSVEQLKNLIPAAALSRNSITTYTDLINYFNVIQTESCKMHLLRKVHNQTERLYFLYLLMKNGVNVIPTNTMNINFTRNMFSSISKNNFVINPGSIYYQEMDEDTATGVTAVTDSEVTYYDENGFLYINPFLMVVNKNPFYMSYFNVIINYAKERYFEYINNDSSLQFIATGYRFYRNFFNNENNETHINLKFTQNINTDYDLVTFNTNGEIESTLINVYAMIYTEDANGDSIPYRYIKGNIINYSATGEITFDFCITTKNKVAPKSTHILYEHGLYNSGSDDEFATYLAPNMRMKFFFFVKQDKEYGRKFRDIHNVEYDTDDYFTNLDGYTLTNIYGTSDEGIDFFYDYTDFMNSFVELNKDSADNFYFNTYKVPLIRYTWLNTEDRFQTISKIFDTRRRFIQNATILLEDSFGIDFKFYNTYGRSKIFNITDLDNIDRINLSLKFEIKFVTKDDQNMLSSIRASIKNYIEDLNNVNDLHIPNLITYITNLYRDNIIYIKFIKLNNYDSLYQSIYKDPELAANYFVETQTVPEFININTNTDNTADIEFDIVY